MTINKGRARTHILANDTNTSEAGPPCTPMTITADRLLPLRAVMEAVGLGKTMIYRLMRQGRFLLAYKPGGHASRWSEREVIAWQEMIARERSSASIRR